MQAISSRTLFPFVGRKHELADLEACLSDAVAGRGRVLLVTGDGGIGKSRLADELSDRAARSGVSTLWGHCWEAGGAPPFWPWIQILRDLSRNEHAATRPAGAYLRVLLPELSAGQGELADASRAALDSEHARFRFFDEVTRFLREASAVNPRLVILEDLHAADLPTLLLLRFLARGLRDARVLVLGTAREVEARRRSAVGQALDVVGREGHRIALGGLEEDEIGELVGRVCGSAPPRELVTCIHRATEGNPFFADETVRLLLSENRGRIPAGFTAETLRVPTRVRDAIRQRLEPLASDSRDVLAVAAVIGKEFDVDVVSGLCDLGAMELHDWLAEVESLGLVRSSTDGHSFVHALIRETVYDDIPADKRVELHARVAEALESLHARDPYPPLAEIAFHFHAGLPRTDLEKTILFTTSAGRRAMELCAYEDAVEQYGLALAALDRVPTREERWRCEILLAIGAARRRVGDVGGSRRAFGEAVDLARTLDQPELFAEAALGFGGPWVSMGVIDEALVELLEEAAVRVGSTALRARLLSRHAMELYFADGSLGRRASLADEAQEIGRQLGDPRVLGEILGARHFALWSPANIDDRLATATAISELARESRNEELTLAGHHWRTIDLVELGDIASADREIWAMEKLATSLRIPVFLWQVTLHRTMRALLDGRFEEAEELAVRALDHGRRAQPESAEGSFLVHMVVLRREQGRLEEVVERVERWVRQYSGRLALDVFNVFVHAELGNRARAHAELERSLIAGPEKVMPPYSWLGSMALLSEVVAAVGDPRRAGVLYDLLTPYAERNAILGRASACLGSVAHYLGLLASTLGRPDAARRHFEDALRQNVLMGARPFEARTRFEYARVLLSDGEPERSLALAREAREITGDLGMEGLKSRVEDLLRELQPNADRSPAPAANTFLREGQFWTVRFQGRVLRLKDSRGLQLIAWLLRHPGKEFHSIELAAISSPASGESETAPGAREMIEEGLAPTRLEGGDDIVDGRALKEYRQRITDLEEELEEAERFRDRGRTERVRSELDALRETLSAAFGLGGRASRSGSPSERARVALTKAIRTALRRITTEDPALGRHFERTIRTGRRFSYDPGEGEGRWTL